MQCVCMYCGFKTALLFVAQLLCVHKISTNFLRQSQPQIKYVFNFCIYHTCMHTANLKKSKVVNQTHNNNYRLHFFFTKKEKYDSHSVVMVVLLYFDKTFITFCVSSNATDPMTNLLNKVKPHYSKNQTT